jgi:curved DNA-binding protein CbpA
MKAALIIVLAIALVVCVAAAEPKKKKKESYYDILGVEQTASEKDLKKAYFKLIVKYHPDKIADFETNTNAQQNFQEISHAYEILSDTVKRERYDRLLSFGQTVYNDDVFKFEDEQEKIKRQEADEKHFTGEPTGKKYKFKDAKQTYEEALREEERRERQEKIETMITYLIGIGAALVVIFVTSIVVKKSSAYQKFEKNKKETETRKNIQANVQFIKKVQHDYEEKLKQEEHDADESTALGEIVRNEYDESKVTKFAGEDDKYEEQVESLVKEHEQEDKHEKSKGNFYCETCKKGFKSQSQLDNHYASNKHKQAVREAEIKAKRATKAKK